MVKIRLMRVGKRKQASYRVVVADSRSPRDGRIIEAIGHYQPREEPSTIAIDADRAVYWLERGAQPSETVRKLLEVSGAWSRFSGEAPHAAEPPRPRATPAASVQATRAAPESEDDAAELPEAADQAAAAPDADVEG